MTVALVLWILAVLVSVAGTILYLVSAFSIGSGPSRGVSYLPNAAFALLGAVVALALAFVMFSGKSWARTALTTIGAMAVASSAASALASILTFTTTSTGTLYATGGIALVVLVPLARILVVLAAIVVGSLPAANRWFSAPVARW